MTSATRWVDISAETVIYNAGMNPKAHEPAVLPAPGPDALAQSETLAAQLRDEIAAAGGWLPFDRFMERALYAPGLGYYSGGARKFGRRADDGSDFVTAPELSPLFAQTLAQPVAEALAASGTRSVMEFGAGTGKLAAGLLAALDALGVELDAYLIVDLSGELRERQHDTITAAAPALAARCAGSMRCPSGSTASWSATRCSMRCRCGCSRRRAAHGRKRGVALDARQAFVFEDRPAAPAGLPPVLAGLDDAADGYVTETHEAALAFTRTVCTMLGRGAVLLVDYGFPAHEYYHPQRDRGTLMCHYRHHAHDDPFLYPGCRTSPRTSNSPASTTRPSRRRRFARLHVAGALPAERGHHRRVVRDRSVGHPRVPAGRERGAEADFRSRDGRAVQGDRVLARHRRHARRVRARGDRSHAL